MRRWLMAWLGLGLLALWACGGAPVERAPDAGAADAAGSGKELQVGLVFDIGGLGDKSFNDGAYRGAQWGARDHGAVLQYIEPEQAADRESGLRMFAERGYELVIGVGFLFTEVITQVAVEFPDTFFVCVDYDMKEGRQVPPNLLAATFREQEGCALVGAAAALVSEKGTLGFVGGMDIPLIRRFESGYRFGAAWARPGTEVLVNYAGVTGEAFANPTKGKELALSQIQAGAEVIFHASGSTGLGVFQAAMEKEILVIGVDSDQAGDAPGYVLTSMLKRVDNLVHRSIRQLAEGELTGGATSFGLKEEALGYVLDDRNRQWLTPEIQEKLETLRQGIESGEIRVPASRTELERTDAG